MTRVVERLEGLLLVGRATIGPLGVETPQLLESRRPEESGPGVSLSSLDAPIGTRRLVLSEGAVSVELTVPVGAPEVLGTAGAVVPAGPHALVVHAPLPPAGLETFVASRPDLIVLGNARTLWSEGQPFVTALRAIRSTFGARPLLWAPRVALPHRIPLLAYLGVDLLDTTAGRISAADGDELSATFGSRRADAAEAPGSALPSDATAERDARAQQSYRAAIEETRFAARTGRLRDLVESRLPAEPALAEMLRYADRDLATLLDERTPVAAQDLRNYVLAESIRRPEMVRFRRRLLERYRPPPSKTILLVVPCSKTKPYRNSPSHRRIWAALEGLPHLERVHLVSVSSPIGVVPRELEDIPPARHYDIPVTGDWSEVERELVGAGLSHLFASGSYRRAVVHLDPTEYGFLRERFPAEVPALWTVAPGGGAGPADRAALRAAIADAVAAEPPVPGGPLAVVREELRELASVQFGRLSAERLFQPPLRLAGRPWFQRLTDGRADLATVREQRGLFHLTIAGARRLFPNPPLSVVADPKLSLEGDLFAPGVRGADPEIRAGDSVIVLRDGALAAVGEAALPGRLMTELDHGLAVRVRHRAHAPTDTAMTAETSRADEGPVV